MRKATAKRQQERATRNSVSVRVAAEAKAAAEEQKLEQAKQAVRAKLKLKRSSTNRHKSSTTCTAGKGKENEPEVPNGGRAPPPATPLHQGKGAALEAAKRGGTMTTGRKTGRKRIFKPETFGDAPCAVCVPSCHCTAVLLVNMVGMLLSQMVVVHLLSSCHFSVVLSSCSITTCLASTASAFCHRCLQQCFTHATVCLHVLEQEDGGFSLFTDKNGRDCR